MKKLLVLSLILGVASLASAGIELRPQEDASAGFVLYNTDGTSWDVYLGVSDGLAITATAITPDNLGTNRKFNSIGTFSWDGTVPGQTIGVATTYAVGVTDTNGLMPVGAAAKVDVALAAGQYWSTEDMGLGLGMAEIGTLDGTMSTLYVVPEPMTMALLGLGGLFLRRRK